LVIVETTPAVARRMQQHHGLRALLEVLVAFGLVEGALWSAGPAQILWAVVALLWVAITTVKAGRPPKTLGIGTAGLRSLLWVIPAALAASGLLVLAASLAGTLHILTGAHTPPWHAALYAIWALVQEFLVQSYIYVRLNDALRNGTNAVILTALLFSLAHLPNPVLTGTTFFLGLGLIFLFRRYRNIYPLALAHAMLGLAVAVSFSNSMTHNMKVGAAYWIR
jgi:membrane protease YdiL (CAAX protease family)